MRVKEASAGESLDIKMMELQELKATVSRFEESMTDIINDKGLKNISKLIMIRSNFNFIFRRIL